MIETNENKYAFLTLDQAESLTQNKTKGFRAFWEGWDLIIWRENGEGFIRPSGMFHDDKWGTHFRIRPNVRGAYRVLARYAEAI